MPQLPRSSFSVAPNDFRLPIQRSICFQIKLLRCRKRVLATPLLFFRHSPLCSQCCVVVTQLFRTSRDRSLWLASASKRALFKSALSWFSIVCATQKIVNERFVAPANRAIVDWLNEEWSERPQTHKKLVELLWLQARWKKVPKFEPSNSHFGIDEVH